jgi:4-hydroxythreonine-4-phosphate dehydrogenase
MPTVPSPAPSPGAPIAVTMGEPAGIGGEILLAAWRRRRARDPVFFALDDPERLRRVDALAGIGASVVVIGDPSEAGSAIDSALPVLPLSREVPAAPGRPDPGSAPAVLESIGRAVSLAAERRAAAVVTNPIHKANLYAAGFAFPGHTEYLAHLAGVGRVVMMLASPELRVVPVTIHVPLRRVPELLTAELIEETALVVEEALRRDFGIGRPRLALAGLNPHAGEGGALGEEDGRVIAPAVARLRERGLDARGPLPADTMFHAEARRGYDAALCMYHDQALIPLKALAFDRGVNATLGLPFVRTSPDHGTALDIAGRGVARPDSLIAAIAMAAELAGRRAAAQGRHEA